MKTMMRVWLAAVASLCALSAPGQILMSSGPYSQNFDTLANNGTSNWVDNSVLPGWYAQQSIGTLSTYRADNGGNNAGAIYSYGTIGTAERALGSVASGTPGNFAYGVRFQNNTPTLLGNVSVSYTGEQWRNGGNTNAQSLVFAYRISQIPITSPDVLSNLTWTPVPALNFNSPTVGATLLALDGNNPTNRSVRTATLVGAYVPTGYEIFLRWFDLNDTGNDHGLALDNLGVTYQPVPPPVINLTCSPNLTVAATSSAGAVVTYTSSATGGCTPPTVNCNPPSGSTFPIGTTTVTCTANDACGTVANCSFTVTVVALPPEFFTGSPTLPPPNTMYISPATWHLLYANGIVIRDVRHRFFTGGLQPPPLGGTQLHTFGSELDFEISKDNGATYQPASGNATVTVKVTHSQDSAGVSFYSTEMEQLDLTSATSFGQIRLRESPTLQSTGQTTVRPVAGGYMVGSFFDVFTELSLDGGATWMPAQQAGHVELRPDTAPVVSVAEPTSLLPPPNDQYISPARWHALFAQGIVIRDVRHKLFTNSVQPPPQGTNTQDNFNSVLDMQVSTDGGKNFQYVRATNVPVLINLANASASGDNNLYDTEMLSLSVSSGLPGGIRIRESPTLPSRGMTEITQLGDGSVRIGSFFDVFPELSVDGGATWQPATNGPVRMQLVSQAPENPEPTPNLPAPGQYVSPADWHAAYANGIIISNASHDRFTQSQPPPPPNGSQTESFGSMVSGQISMDHGVTFQPFSAPADVGVQVTSHSSLDTGGTRFFDTEMLSLSLAGGTLPGGVMVRESPSKASLGRTSIRQNPVVGQFLISSFFDVFTELSVDGGQTWSPLTNRPGTVALKTNSPIEVDYFPNTTAEITLQDPNGGTEVVRLNGPTTVNVMVGPNGQAADTDGDGLDQVGTEMVQMDLIGLSTMGPVGVTLTAGQHSYGGIEETVNNNPGTLDVPPFTPTGSANSFFDVFVDITVGGQTLRPATPLHMQSVIRHKPPGPGDSYVNPFTTPVPLLDANGNPTGFKVLREVHTPNPTNPPPVEIDHFTSTTAQITLRYPSGGSEVVTLTGPTTVKVNIPPNGRATDTDGNGLDQVTTEMVEMDLSGPSAAGLVHATLDPSHRTMGQIEETANNNPGILDIPPFAPAGTANSFFDVFVQIEVGGQVLHPATPLRMTSLIHHKPPAPGDTYVNPFTQPVELVDASGNLTGYRILQEVHTPNPTNRPPVEVDYFPNTTAQITLRYASGQTEVVSLSGPTTVHVNIPPNGAASDTDGNGRDQVTTEMVSLELNGASSLGLVTAELDPYERSFGGIEETANNTPGILDVPPFTPTGTANSFFDIFVELHVAGQTLYPETPLHMTSLIHHKPPAPGDIYVNPFSQPVNLLDAFGNPTGIQVLNEVHTPVPTNPPPVEIDRFPNTTASITLQYANGQIEVVEMAGPTTVKVNIPPSGAASDTDGNGLDQVTTEMVELELSGASSMGPVKATLDESHRSLGQIEETANNTPGTLDIPPFTPTGSASSFFDVFVTLQVAGQTLHPATPLHMTSIIHHKPPAPGDTYINPFTIPVPLLDAAGNPTGIKVLREVHTPNPTNPPPIEIDYFPSTTAQITLQLPSGGSEVVNLSGPTTVHVAIPPSGFASDTDGNGLDQVDTEMVDMHLSGTNSQGLVTVTLDPARPTLGGIEERTNTTPGVLDVQPFTAAGSANSYFDVFAVIQVGGKTLRPATPIHMTSVIHHKPPAPGDVYVNPFTTPIPLVDQNGVITGYKILAEVHTPNPTNPPPVEIDHFTNTTAQVTLQYPSGGSEVVSLSGPTTVRVNIPPNGAASDTDANGRDQVTTEMVEMNLSGASGMGPVTVSLDTSHRSLGQIEETSNNTPGTLDVPPFRPIGTASSFFDVFVTIQVAGQTLHPATPLRMSSLIHHKPPAPGDTYTNTFTQPVVLLDTNGFTTGFKVLREIHTPNPTNPPPIEVDYFSNTTAQVTLQYPSGGTEVVTLSGPTTVTVMIPPNGAASDTDGNGRDQVSTEMVQLNLSGVSSVGLVTANLDPTHRSTGEIEETANTTPGILDIPPFAPTGTASSFFDVFVQLQVGGQTLHPAAPLHMSSLIHHKPPSPGDTYTNTFLIPVDLLDANGNPTGIKIVREVHTPNPTNPQPVEIDYFPKTEAQVVLQYQNGQTEVVSMSGPTTVRVNIAPNGAATDSDGNGLDQVSTEMTDLTLAGASAMGPITAMLDPTKRSFGQIEETANNTPGTLDVPPFRPTGTASSFFDVFVVFQVAGQTLHPAGPLHMSGIIHHKPPGPGDTYVNPFTAPVPLLDANGNPTGIRVLREVHTPNPTNPAPVEVDYFSNTTAQVTLQLPNGQTEVVSLSGPTTVNVLIPPSGLASDTDGNGLDQVNTEMVQLDLSGASSLGAVSVNLDPDQHSLGEIEETVNRTPGILDVPPFTQNGSANSFFDVFVELHVGGQTLHPAMPLHMTAVITHKPPAPGDTYVNPFTIPVDLLDANGNPTGIKIVREVHTPVPRVPIEIDHFPNTTASITLQLPGGGNQVVSLSGPTTVQVQIGPNGAASDIDGNGLDQAPTEMTDMHLTGVSAMGPVTVTLDPAHRSFGQIEETVNNTPGILDVPPFTPTGTASSFFDVFVQVQIGPQVFHLASPLRMACVIRHKPPQKGDDYVNPFTQPIQLLDANGNPTGIYVVREVHTPNPTNPPPVEIDHFPNTSAQITLQTAGGQTEVVSLSGPSTVQVNIGPNGQASDLDGNGRDQVTTEMTQMNLSGNSSMGPVTINLDPLHASLGQIEENLNNIAGILDVPPFTPTGTASSFFDVFVEIHVGGQTLHPATPLHMAATIRHKPPQKGDDYINPFTQPVLLLDANGNPTGIKIVREVHTPNPTNPAPVEIDHFPSTTAQITLQLPGGGTEVVSLSGPTTVHVNVGPTGAASDLDGNGLDQVTTEMTQMSLSGGSSLGPVTVSLDTTQPSLGQIEETANNTPGILDVPPFTPTGTASSFFDVFAVVKIGPQTLHPATPLHMTSIIRHKPPQKGDVYINPFTQPIVLLDAAGNPTGFKILREVHTPNPTNPPPVEIDHFPNTTAQITIQKPGGQTEVVSLSGPSTVHVNTSPTGAAADTDGNGLDQVTTEMTDMNLSGNSSVGPVTVTLDPSQPSMGQIEETANNTPGTLDLPPFTPAGTANSFFDIFAVIKVGGQTLYPATPLHMTSVIHHKPPRKGDDYINPFTQPIPLLDANGNVTGYRVLGEVHTPNPTNPPPVEIDHFPNTTASITLQKPGGGSEVVALSGPTTVHVNIGPNGAAADTDGDGLDQVATEMTQMSLSGNSSLGPVTVSLDPTQPAYGQIEETVNNTPGILDVPPFTPTGTANSFFDVFLVVHVGNQTLYPAAPLHMTSLIRHKPPRKGDDYVNPFTQPIPLLDGNGNVTGYQVLQEVHTPNPTNPPPVEIDHFPNTTASITLQKPGGGSEVVSLSGPTTVHVNIGPGGAALDLDGNGRDQVTTEMTSMLLSGNSSLGPVVVDLDPAQPSMGQIEETVNNTPGILDIPPFRPTGTADSTFDVFTRVHVAGQTLYPASPLHMHSIIRHKPPSTGDDYVNPFTQPIPLLDANGNVTGYQVLQEVHTPNPTNPPSVEIDSFPNTTAQITLQLPSGGSEAVNLSGPTTVHVNIGPSGQALDMDGDGLDQVTTEMTAMNLTGNSSMGPVSVTLDPMNPTMGQIEETINNTPGILDVPPFRPTGTANSFFDVFAKIQIGAQTYYPEFPLHMQSVISHKPPAPGDHYNNPFTQPIQLFDAAGNPTGFKVLQEVHTPNPTNTTIPILLRCSSNLTATATSSNGATVFFTSSASGGCSPPPFLSCNPPSGSTFPIGTTTVTCTASDTCGTATNCSFLVTVVRPPIALTCSSNIAVNATSASGATVFFSSSASGGCSPPPFISCNPPSGSTFPIGTTTVTCTASDTCGGTTNCSFFVTVVRPPIALTCSSNITVNATSASGATVFFSSSASGGCSPPPFISCNPPSGSTFPIGTTTVTCTASDTCGGTTNCSFFVTVVRPPIALTCSTNINVTTTNAAGTTVFYTSTATGGCPPLAVFCNPPSGSSFPIGTTTVTCTASNACGGFTNCSFLVTVTRTNSPILLTCSSNIIVTTTNPAGAVVFYTSTATGGCPPVAVVCNPPSGSTFPLGITSVTCLANDACGQTTNCNFTITVIPKKRPFLTNSLPPIAGQYVSPAQWHALYAGGIYVSNVSHRRFTASFPPPASGTVTHSFNSEVDFQYSTDNGNTYHPATASALCTVSVTVGGASGGDQVYQTEMLQLDISGGTLPAGMRLRESPTRQSLGQTRIAPGTGGIYLISSFFDVFTELSIDNGNSWLQATNPGHMDLHVDPAVLPTTLVQPRLTGGQLQVSLPSQLGLRYTLQFKNTLIAPAWQNLGTASGNGQTIILTDPQILPSRFYRVLVEEDPSQ